MNAKTHRVKYYGKSLNAIGAVHILMILIKCDPTTARCQMPQEECDMDLTDVVYRDDGLPRRARMGLYDQLIQDGYCRLGSVLERDMLGRLRTVTDCLLSDQNEDQSAAQRSTGSMISVTEDALFAELVAYPRALDALAQLGFVHPRWSSGFVISKPPDSPALFWHQDWWGWNDISSYMPIPQQLFLMYYLVDTSPNNGCLRLLRGSHLKRHQMHDTVPDAHTDELRRMVDPDHPAYQSIAEEVDVPVRAGDLVIGDSRILHSAHANKSDARRTVITLWYHPFYDLLPEGLRAAIGRPRVPGNWSESAWQRVEDAGLTAHYEGNCEPTEWNRIPDSQLV
tara:strand:- start:418 stop:1434 length:1017 start_codon:yes stop_codon:yes gene_type:complete